MLTDTLMKTTPTLLVVEDEVIVARDLQATLEDLGYSVPEIADSGEMAIQLAVEIRPNLVLMDIRLKGEIDGITAASIISQELEIPVVYMTAHTDENTLARAKLTGPFGYIIKPYEERELRTTIEIALHKYEMDKQVRSEAKWLSTVLRSIGDAIIVTDTTGTITFMNSVAEELTAWSIEDAIGKEITEVFQIIEETTRKAVPNPLIEALETGKICHLPDETLLLKKNGAEVPIDDSAAPLLEGVGKIAGGVLVFRDLTARKLVAEKLRFQAFHDPLTKLPNRAWFMERLEKAGDCARENPDYLFAVLFLDLDRFKLVNDSLGHKEGDRLLIDVASKLSELTRQSDAVARWGGDKFVILLENVVNVEEACQVAQRIQRDLMLPIKLDEHDVFTSASIGIVLSSIGSQTTEGLLQDATIASNGAKSRGQGRYQVFDRSMRARVESLLQLEKDLRRAIERDELVIYYQPIVCLTDGNIKGFEALVRWNHPQRGFLLPQDFIPVAEETGLIISLDWWIVREACRQMRCWQDTFKNLPDLTICVNLSSKHFALPKIVDKIQQTLETTGLEPRCLSLEITEKALLENADVVAPKLSQLKTLEVCLSLDDFGTGYSSLSYLHGFTLNSIKIDRTLIGKIPSDRPILEIVRTIVQLAGSLNMKAIAEGVETEEQLAILKEIGCELGQGYFFYKPLSAEEVERQILSGMGNG